MTTVPCWEALRSIVAGCSGRPLVRVRPTLGMLILCGAPSMGFGALNEVVEFQATMLVPETNVGAAAAAAATVFRMISIIELFALCGFSCRFDSLDRGRMPCYRTML